MNENSRDQDAESEDEQPQERPLSPWAAELKRLKSAAWSASSSRERLPQPLFWSLFHSVIGDIRKQKARKRLLENVFDGSGEESPPEQE